MTEDIEMGAVGDGAKSDERKSERRSQRRKTGSGPRSHFDYDYNEETDDLIADIAESTNSLIFSKFYSSVVLSHVVLLAQISASVVILRVPYEVYRYHNGGRGPWLTLFGILLMSSEIYAEWNDLTRHFWCYTRQSRLNMILTFPHLLLVAAMAFLVPVVICKVLASANYNDPIGVLTGFTGIFILFDADGQFFSQLHYGYEDSRISTKKLKDLRKYKTPLVLVFIPLLVFVIFECYFMALSHCGNLLTGDSATSECVHADD